MSHDVIHAIFSNIHVLCKQKIYSITSVAIIIRKLVLNKIIFSYYRSLFINIKLPILDDDLTYNYYDILPFFVRFLSPKLV